MEFDPDVILYMVGESIYMDELVLKVCEMTGKPLVLYNGEAYRIIDLRERHGIERAYYKRVENLYARLNSIASLTIYNSELLKQSYDAKYGARAPGIIAYNSAEGIYEKYSPNKDINITYFGNLGVGRVESLLKVADALQRIDEDAAIDVYGNAMGSDRELLEENKGIRYHGFIDAEQLVDVINKSDILLHVESFLPEIRRKLKYAFSTKIAQCLRAGRCLVTYAPKETASTEYLLKEDAAVVCSYEENLEAKLEQIIRDETLRTHFAEKAYSVGMKNHDSKATSEKVREIIEETVVQ